MKKNQFLVLQFLFCFLAVNSYAQKEFKEGYIINNQNEKIDCLINYYKKLTSPEEVTIKLNENSEAITYSKNEVKFFEVLGEAKFIRSEVEIDQSAIHGGALTYNKQPDNQKKIIFLNILVEGNQTLYVYETNNLTRYYFKNSKDEIEQLIYKKYQLSQSVVVENQDFKKQLNAILTCNVSFQSINKAQYHKKDLVNLFKTHNTCSGDLSVSYEENKMPPKYNFYVKAGLQSATMGVSIETTETMTYSKDVKISNKLGVKLGAEFEVVLPYNNYSTSLFLEALYQNFEHEKEIQMNFDHFADYTERVKVDYKSIEFLIGGRHNFINNKKYKLMGIGGLVFDVPLKNSTIKFDYAWDNKMGKDFNFMIGIGTRIYDRFIVDLRYNTPRNNLNLAEGSNGVTKSNYQSLSMIFGYKFL